MSMKNPLTLAGIEPATFLFVAQHLNHCATAVPKLITDQYSGMKRRCCVVIASEYCSTSSSPSQQYCGFARDFQKAKVVGAPFYIYCRLEEDFESP